MTMYYGHDYAETIDISGVAAPVPPETAHGVHAYGGNDIVKGSAYTDFLWGDGGNDTLYGNAGNDVLLGGDGNDTNYGGAGDDCIYDGAGADILDGGAGDDLLWGGAGNDTYRFYAGYGLDVINDDKSPTGATGYGGGTDVLRFGYTDANTFIGIGDPGDNNLYITTYTDMADGVMDAGVVIENFFLGGNNVIEQLITSDNHTIYLTDYL